MRTQHGDLPTTADHQRVPHAKPYYEALDRGHDDLLRCHDCNRLVLYKEMMANRGLTLCCGTRKTHEVRALSFWEWLKVRVGLIDFDYRHEFLAEFARRGGQ